jgi:hypothetical protein
MGTINDLTEELYQDGDLRKEFEKFIQLRTQYKAIIEQINQNRKVQQLTFLSYSAITTSIYQEQFELNKEVWKIKGLPEGLFFLSRSLVKTIAQRYNLPIDQASQLARLVADKYEQEQK